MRCNFSCHGRNVWSDLQGARGTLKSSPGGPRPRRAPPRGGGGAPWRQLLWTSARRRAEPRPRGAADRQGVDRGVFPGRRPGFHFDTRFFAKNQILGGRGRPPGWHAMRCHWDKCAFAASEAAWGRAPRRLSRITNPSAAGERDTEGGDSGQATGGGRAATCENGNTFPPQRERRNRKCSPRKGLFP